MAPKSGLRVVIVKHADDDEWLSPAADASDRFFDVQGRQPNYGVRWHFSLMRGAIFAAAVHRYGTAHSEQIRCGTAWGRGHIAIIAVASV